MLPVCQRGGQCPCIVDGENLALDEEISQQVETLQYTLLIHEATQDPQALKGPFEQFGLYQDTLSYFEIIKTWNQFRANQKPKTGR